MGAAGVWIWEACNYLTAVLHGSNKSFVKVVLWQFREPNAARIWTKGNFDDTNESRKVELHIAALKLLIFVPQPPLSFVAEEVIFRGKL